MREGNGGVLSLRAGRGGISESLRAKGGEPLMTRAGGGAVQLCKRQHLFVNEKAVRGNTTRI